MEKNRNGDCMEKLLLFQVGEPEAGKIKKLALAKKIKTEILPAAAYTHTLKELKEKGGKALFEDKNKMLAEEKTSASLVLFCDVQEKHFNKLLFEMKNKKIEVDYKAVLTPSNQEWTIGQLLAELEKERREFMALEPL